MTEKICRVLVVEDSREIQELLESVFVTEGYHFSVVSNGAEMRSEIAKGDVDVVVIDVVLPGADTGFALANEVAARGCAVVLVSGHPSHFATATTSGYSFLQKPFRIQALLAVVDEALHRARRDCELRRKAS
jgi:DNA-binding NtrC family response regulator